MTRKLRMGMIGGGKDAFIGSVHRAAAALDGRIELVCGALSSTRNRALESGRELGLPPERTYATYRDLFKKEMKLPEDERMDFVAIVTPNNMHYPTAMAALDSGFHVVCDKPMTVSLDEARNLKAKVRRSKKLLCLTHNYTGTPMVKEAADLVRRGRLGSIRRVVVEYPQGWLASRVEANGHKQAAWRTDPRRSGPSCCMSDIGSQCANLAEFITGSEISEVAADLATSHKGRQLDDDGSVLLRFKDGARGVLWASQIAVGEDNGLNIRVYGEKGSLEWHQQAPDTLIVHGLNKHTEIRRKGSASVGKRATTHARLPAGYPEGYLEAFANIYRNFADDLLAAVEGRKRPAAIEYPGVDEGLRSMAFLEAVVRSSKSKEKWVEVAC